MDSAHSMLYQVNLYLVFWSQAVSTAACFMNRNPTINLTDMTSCANADLRRSLLSLILKFMGVCCLFKFQIK